MNPAEILALVTVLLQTVPNFAEAWAKISANSNGNVRPLAEIWTDTDALFDKVDATAQNEIAKTKAKQVG